MLAPTKSCLIIVVILYRYNDLSSICNQNTFDEENFDFQIDTASHKAYPLHNLSTKISDILMVSVADFFLVIYLENDTQPAGNPLAVVIYEKTALERAVKLFECSYNALPPDTFIT